MNNFTPRAQQVHRAGPEERPNRFNHNFVGTFENICLTPA